MTLSFVAKFSSDGCFNFGKVRKTLHLVEYISLRDSFFFLSKRVVRVKLKMHGCQFVLILFVL